MASYKTRRCWLLILRIPHNIRRVEPLFYGVTFENLCGDALLERYTSQAILPRLPRQVGETKNPCVNCGQGQGPIDGFTRNEIKASLVPPRASGDDTRNCIFMVPSLPIRSDVLLEHCSACWARAMCVTR